MTEAEFSNLVRKYLVLKRYDGKIQRQIRSEAQKRGDATYQRVLETEIQKAIKSDIARYKYLMLAYRLGKSDIYWKTALNEIKAAKSDTTIANTLNYLSRYLENNAEAHKGQLAELSKELWSWANKSGGGPRAIILDYLAGSEPDKVRTFIEKKLTEKQSDEDRKGLIVTFAKIENIAKKDRLSLLKKELDATKSSYLASIIRYSLEPIVGKEEAYRLTRSKIQAKKYRGKTQTELRKTGVSFQFIDTPLSEGLNFFREQVGLDFQIAPEAQKIVDARFSTTLSARETPAMTAMIRFLVPVGLTCKVQGKSLIIVKGVTGDTTTASERAKIRTRLAAKVSMELKSTRIDEALALLGSLALL